MGRIIPRKGVLRAIEVARAAGLPIKVVGPLMCEDANRVELPPDVEHIPAVGVEERAKMMAAAGLEITNRVGDQEAWYKKQVTYWDVRGLFS
jgi:hypothetical protein